MGDLSISRRGLSQATAAGRRSTKVQTYSCTGSANRQSNIDSNGTVTSAQ
jgi:hypothetical protein